MDRREMAGAVVSAMCMGGFEWGGATAGLPHSHRGARHSRTFLRPRIWHALVGFGRDQGWGWGERFA